MPFTLISKIKPYVKRPTARCAQRLQFLSPILSAGGSFHCPLLDWLAGVCFLATESDTGAKRGQGMEVSL